MELGTAIIAISFILACITPFVLISRSNKKRDMQLLQGLVSLAQKSNYNVSKYDIWKNAAIGADESANMIFFTKKVKDQELAQQVALAEVQECRVINTNKTHSDSDGALKIIEKLELAFRYQDKSREETVMVLYDAHAETVSLSGELQLAEKWCKMVNDKIKTFGTKK